MIAYSLVCDYEPPGLGPVHCNAHSLSFDDITVMRRTLSEVGWWLDYDHLRESDVVAAKAYCPDHNPHGKPKRSAFFYAILRQEADASWRLDGE